MQKEEHFAEFHIILTEDDPSDPRGADAILTTIDLDGTLTARVPLDPNSENGPSEVTADCWARGPTRTETADTTVTIHAV